MKTALEIWEEQAKLPVIRGSVYLDGLRRSLLLRLDGGPSYRNPHRLGTSQADAFAYGEFMGRMLAELELASRKAGRRSRSSLFDWLNLRSLSSEKYGSS